MISIHLDRFLSHITLILLFSGLLVFEKVLAQPSITNPDVVKVLQGNYNPNNYLPSNFINDKDSILDQINMLVSADSLKSYLIKLESFQTRHTASDTVSNIRGIGAARRWIHKKFLEFSSQHQNRLLVSHLNFTTNICGVNEHRNVLAVLPGLDTSKNDIVLVEAHMDSRCKGSCDTSCYAPGMDDNGSGTALVIELSRVMSGLSFDRTIVFTTVTGEEQGLHGGNAMATYLKNNNVPFLACLNNDVVGGIECGVNSSPPSCTPEGSIDSLNLRVFSYSPGNDTDLISEHKQLARYVKLQQIEEVNPRSNVKVNLSLQIREDRVGRGGDHIPFRQKQLRAIRFTSSHEHGNGAGNAPDRQHTTTDVLGFDTSIPPDGILDTFLVDFNYLKRNTLTNAINLAMLAKSPPIPQPIYEQHNFGNIKAIRFENEDTLYSHRIGVRSRNSPDLYYDSIFSFNEHYIPVSKLSPKGKVQFHVMNLDGEIESIATTHADEDYLNADEKSEHISCIQLFPNPAKNVLNLKWNCALQTQRVEFQIIDITGNIVLKKEVEGAEIKIVNKLDIVDLSSGAYKFIYIVNRRELFTETLIIN